MIFLLLLVKNGIFLDFGNNPFLKDGQIYVMASFVSIFKCSKKSSPLSILKRPKKVWHKSLGLSPNFQRYLLFRNWLDVDYFERWDPGYISFKKFRGVKHWPIKIRDLALRSWTSLLILGPFIEATFAYNLCVWGHIYTWRRICQRILNEVSTNSRRIINKEFFFVDEFLKNKILRKQTYKGIENGVSQKIIKLNLKFKILRRRRKILRRVFIETSLSIRWQILRHVKMCPERHLFNKVHLPNKFCLFSMIYALCGNTTSTRKTRKKTVEYFPSLLEIFPCLLMSPPKSVRKVTKFCPILGEFVTRLETLEGAGCIDLICLENKIYIPRLSRCLGNFLEKTLPTGVPERRYFSRGINNFIFFLNKKKISP